MDGSIAERQTRTTPDEVLVQRARLGDLGAFDTLIATRLVRCYRLARAILDNDADAADATQEAFVAAWRNVPHLRDPASFDGWLNRIVANAARSCLRHRVRLREIRLDGPDDEDAELGPPGGADPGIDHVAQREAIGRAFDRLRLDDRVLLVLHHVEERPIAEIARSLRIPEGTAKRRLHDARRALERAMEAES